MEMAALLNIIRRSNIAMIRNILSLIGILPEPQDMIMGLVFCSSNLR